MSKKMPGRLERRHIDTVVAISTCGSIHGAARELGLAQPVVTNLLRDSERILGRQLFARSHKGCSILPDAQSLLSSAIYAWKALESLDHTGKTAGVTLCLGCIPRVMHSLVPILMQQLYRTSGLLRVEFTEGTARMLNAMLIDGKLDCVIGRQPMTTEATFDNLAIENLYEEQTVLIASNSHPLAKEPLVELKGLIDYPWILPRNRSYSKNILHELFSREGLKLPRPLIESLSFLSDLHLVSKSRCISIAPERAAQEFENAGLIKIIKISSDLGKYVISMMYHQTLLDRPGFMEFIAAVKMSANSLPSAFFRNTVPDSFSSGPDFNRT